MQSTGRHTRAQRTGARRSTGVWALVLLVALVGLAVVALMACGGGAVARTGQGAAKSAQADTKKEGPDIASVSSSGPVSSAGAPKDQSASAVSQEAKFFCYVETLTADRPSIYGYLAPRGCQPSGVFKRAERMVWRFQVLDVATGQMVTPTEAASVKVRVPFVGDMDADFKQRGEGRVADAPWTWDYCWDVPPDYPLGTLDYSIVITLKDGRTGTWKPPALVDPSRGIDSRPQIIE